MAAILTRPTPVLAEVFGPGEGLALRLKQAALVAAGIALLAIMAKIRVPLPETPIYISMGTFAVLALGAAYGPRLGLVTILGYMIVGALGFDVFQSSTAQLNGLSYMAGSTGGYLAGYVLAVVALGAFARAGWDRSVWRMAVAMLVGNLILYVPGLLWLAQWIVAGDRLDTAAYGSLWAQTLAWGATPFLVGDLLKLALAALVVPAAWRLVGRARG